MEKFKKRTSFANYVVYNKYEKNKINIKNKFNIVRLKQIISTEPGYVFKLSWFLRKCSPILLHFIHIKII